jgi:hypothetical protein
MIITVGPIGVVGMLPIKPTSCKRCPNVPPTKTNVCQLFFIIFALKRLTDSCNGAILNHLGSIKVGFTDCCIGDPIGQTPCICCMVGGAMFVAARPSCHPSGGGGVKLGV